MAVKVLNEFLPEAEFVRLGGIKVGDTLQISDGVLNTNTESTGTGGNKLISVPRKINVSLNTSTHILTINSGTEVWCPDGFESDGTTLKFKKITTTQNYIRGDGETFGANKTYAVCYEPNAGNVGFRVRERANSISGIAAPTGTTAYFWYDTLNNKMKCYNSGAFEMEGQSFPICWVTTDASGYFTKVNILFDGFGLIGTTIFAIPGMRALIPNGFDSNGIPQYTTAQNTTVLTTNATLTGQTLYLYMSSTALIASNEYFYDMNSNRNRLISNSNTSLNMSATGAWVYWNSGNVITSMLKGIVAPNAYEEYPDVTNGWQLQTNTYINGNKGRAFINSINSNGQYTAFNRYKSDNGVFTTAGYQTGYYVNYTADTTIASNTNAVTHQVKLLDESGNASFPGNIAAAGTLQATATTAYWADLAEKYITDKKYPIGTLVTFGGEKEMTLATKKVNGVISEKPGYTLNAKSKGQPIALIGKTKVRVIGIVDKGDKLVLYKDGVARTRRWYDIFKKTIGITLEANIKPEEKLVMSVVQLVM